MKTCTDINECMTGSHGCSHKCSNNDGSFTCTCHAGYALAADKKTCQDVNECDTPVLNNCSQVCENNNGSFQCSCDDGFSLAPDNTSCTANAKMLSYFRYNECGSVSPCSAGVCDNIPGSFQCTCPVGTSYSGGKCTKTRTFAVSLTLARVNGKVVVWDVLLLKQDSAKFGVLARRVETQLNVFYRGTSNFSSSYVGCRVRNFRQGSVVADVDLNFNENATDVTPNTLNSELPQSGQIGNMTYDPQTAAISDFNECNDQSTHNCDRHAICINKPGTFECKCQDGYQGNGLTCDSAPEPADPEDDNKKERLAIIFGVLGGILALLILILLCFACRRKRYKAAFAGEDSNSPHNLTARSARSDVYFPEGGKDKEERTGSYEINPGPIYENPAPESRASGDYDYPDPFPGGTRQTAVYDNPGLQRESGPVKASHSDSAL
ncbi:hypothetical protein OS493_027559 [Desmophyllum pertusum]|uniref:Uncharacterized protein n=1 Tax=Desmophyllum pertusum TaxID=174260 RepID=A0A9W9ZZH1_9CNID|nr:hypothetical protein OS493_027559 [Desmophyllum pertusum]